MRPRPVLSVLRALDADANANAACEPRVGALETASLVTPAVELVIGLTADAPEAPSRSGDGLGTVVLGVKPAPLADLRGNQAELVEEFVFQDLSS